MSGLDVEGVLAPISEESPCGPDLSYDPDYLELERLAQGTPEQQVGDSIIEAQEPNWSDIRDRSETLLKRSKDLRIAVYRAVAALKDDGATGLRDGLVMLHRFVDQLWDQFHPQLDPDDGNDPLERMNILASLASTSGGYGDPIQYIKRIREVPLSASRQLGHFSFRDVMIARGEATSSGDGPAPEMAVIEASFEDTEIDDLRAVADSLQEAGVAAQALDDAVTQRVGGARAPDLSAMHDVIKEVSQFVGQQMARRGYGSGGEEPEAAEADLGDGPSAEGGGSPLTGDIRSRDDVLRALEKVCQYFERYEPSSPVPLLVRRAQRLVSKNFLDIIRDLSPHAMDQIQMISGSDGAGDSEN